MSQHRDKVRGCEFIDRSLKETPAQYIDLGAWPKRDCVRLPIVYCEWFDWSELFSSGVVEKLASIVKGSSSEVIYASGLSTDSSSAVPSTLRVTKIASNALTGTYFKAIWDESSMAPFGPLAAAARVTLMWDDSQEWLVIGDRCFEIGIFVVVAKDYPRTAKNVFHCLDEQVLLDRYSRISGSTRLRLDPSWGNGLSPPEFLFAAPPFEKSSPSPGGPFFRRRPSEPPLCFRPR
jgi:hypothetical protein